MGQLGFTLCLVHGGIGCRVDDDVRLVLIQHRGNVIRAGQVQLLAIQADALAQHGQRAAQFEAQLAVDAGNQDAAHALFP
jgi:hypothetical protein